MSVTINFFFKKEHTQKRSLPLSLLDLTTYYIYANSDKFSESDLKKLSIELQERLEILDRDYKFSLYAFSNIQNDHLKVDFLKYLTNNDDAYSYAALGTYFMCINDMDNASKYLSLAIQNRPDALPQFLSNNVEYFDLISHEMYEKINSHVKELMSNGARSLPRNA